MDEAPKKKANPAMIIVAIVLVAVAIYYFSTMKKAENSNGLSDAERSAILNDLSDNQTTPIPDSDKQNILKDLSNSSSGDSTLTDAEKQSILNSFN